MEKQSAYKNELKYGFFGAGNICCAVITGAVKNGVSPEDIYVFDIDGEKSHNLARSLGVKVETDTVIAENAEVIFFGLKPNVLPGALTQLREVICRRTDAVVVSFAAGVALTQLDALLPGTRIMRALPNLNSAIGLGMTAVCANSQCSQRDVSAVTGFMSACGEVITLEEKLFNLCSVLSGSTPAFTYIYIDALARAALALGLDKRRALQIAAQSVLGSAKMILESTAHPWELADRVCSPGGLTVEGVSALKEHTFEHAVMEAVKRAVAKNDSL